MSKIYIFKGGGQRARQNAELGHPFVYEVDNNSNWAETSKQSGQTSFTNAIWNEDFETFKRDIEEWAGEDVELECEQEYSSRQEMEEERLLRLKDFFSSRPAITVTGFAKESGVSHSLLKFILQGDRNITHDAWKRIESTMIKYGYNN